jgi:hypothetical protein
MRLRGPTRRDSFVGMLRRSASVVLFALIGLAGSASRANAADAGTGGDLSTLEKQLVDERTTLATLLANADCVSACKALGSIQRAADRICALEPGPRCDAAKEKAADATRRVREACPDCAFALRGTEPPAPKPEPERAVVARTEGSAPPREEPRRGCASCTTAPTPDLGDFALVFGVLAGVDLLRRRTRRRL